MSLFDDEPYVYQPRAPWKAPQHARRFDGVPDSPMYPLFFWSLFGEPMLQRTPPGSFPFDRDYLPRHSIDVVMPPVEPDATVVAASYVGEPPRLPHEGPTYDNAVDAGAAVRCPTCRWVSYHPQDILSGWCANCQTFTGAVPAGGYPIDQPGYPLRAVSRGELLPDSYVREDATA